MKTALPIIIIAVCVAVCTWIYTSIHMNRQAKATEAKYIHKMDSVTSVNARLTTEVDTLKALAARHTANGDSIARTNVTTIILNDARKATRNATVDSLDAILSRFPD